jgi:methylenetetrahydrofolate reductase (NADPH)
MVSLMPLPATVAEKIHAGAIPGIIVTEDLLQRVREESAGPDKGAAARMHRLALQIVGCKLLGLAGAQVTGIHSAERASELLGHVECLERDLPAWDQWQRAWDDANRLSDGRVANLAPINAYYWDAERDTAQASTGERVKFYALDLLHRGFFETDSPGRGLFVQAGKVRLLEPLLMAAEEMTKKPVVGCDTCGFCRLPYTQYVCPETCPKGLANGPCGGTNDNTCEFKDRECIHNRRYRLAKAQGRLQDLEEVIVPQVPETTRHTCSWTNHFQQRDPVVVRLK